MIVANTIKQVREIIKEAKLNNKTIGFVPTMGALHGGHSSLIEKSINENDFTLVSIFVNPIQFDNKDDLEAYPLTFEKDKNILVNLGVDLVFHPSPDEILGDNLLTTVNVQKLTDNLCGKHREGHFQGVCTIVTKLFNIVMPHNSYFGKKDIQQLYIIKKMVVDLNIDINIVPCDIVREKDGLALSSRNVHLSEEERKDASVLNQSLKNAISLIENGMLDSKKIINLCKALIKDKKMTKIDYFSIVDENMKDVDRVKKGNIIAMAVYVGKTRLIDNHIIGEKICW